jgi:hypothetical protein
MLRTWLFHLLQTHSRDFIFQQDGAPPHWSLPVRAYLNEPLYIQKRRIGRNSGQDCALRCTVTTE